jgi:hypothetical protein
MTHQGSTGAGLSRLCTIRHDIPDNIKNATKQRSTNVAWQS